MDVEIKKLENKLFFQIKCSIRMIQKPFQIKAYSMYNVTKYLHSKPNKIAHVERLEGN